MSTWLSDPIGLLLNSAGVNGYIQGLIILTAINMIAVIGVSILTGFTRLFSFGNAGFIAIGAYASALLSAKCHVPFLAAILLGALVAGFVGYLLGKATLSLKGDYFLIATLGFGESLRVLLEYTDKITGGARGFSGIPQKSSATVVLISVVICIFVARSILNSKYGRNFTSIREQEIAAEAVGISTAKYKNLSFVVSAVFAGLAGALYAHYLTFVTPSMFNLDKSAELTITVVVGGLGSLTGSIVATIILTLLPELLRAVAFYRMFLYGVAVVLIIVLRPAGLMGYSELSFKWIKSLARGIRFSNVDHEAKE